MNRRAVLVIGLVASFTAPAAADTIDGLQMQLSDEALSVRVVGVRGAPRVRTNRGLIRAWFPEVDGHPRIDQSGDGHVVEALRVRPGAMDTGLLQIHLGDRRRLEQDDVEVVREDGAVVIRVDRLLLPATPEEEAPEEESAPPPPEDVEEEAEATAEAPAADEETTEVVEAATPAPAMSLSTSALQDATREDSPLPYGALMLLAALLLGLHFLMRWIAKKRKITLEEPELDVVASKRIGPRQSLIVVRALGEEHLLLMQGKQTQHIASVQRDGGEIGAIEEELALRRAARPEPALPKPEKKQPEERFGAALLKLAGKREDRAEVPSGTSPAVAGLLRLKQSVK